MGRAALEVTRAFGSGLGGVLALALPVACAGCGRADVRWCDACAPALLGRGMPLAALTGAPLVVTRAPPTSAVALYDGPVRAAVLSWKERGRADMSPVLARALAAAMLAAARGWEDVLVVPAPSSWSARRARGADVVADLARAAAARCRRAGVARWRVAPVLRQRQHVADQAGLGVGARDANLSGRLMLRLGGASIVRGRRVLVVDDVATTGATLAEATRVVSAAGALVGAAAVVAVTPRRSLRAPGRSHGVR